MNAHDILFYGNRTLLQGIERIPPPSDTPGVVGWWSARETMAHLAVFEAGLVEVLTAFEHGGAPSMLSNMDSSKNDELVAQKKDKSFDELLAEYSDAHAKVMTLVSEISPDRLREVGAIPWYGDDYSMDDFLVYTYYGHKREHTARFEAFGDRLDKKSWGDMSIAKIREEIPIKLNSDGVYLVGGTRVPLDTVIRAHERGASAETIARQYPALQLADVYFVIGYYLNNQAKVEAYLRQRERQAEQIRKTNKARFPQKGVKSRLAARSSKTK